MFFSFLSNAVFCTLNTTSQVTFSPNTTRTCCYSVSFSVLCHSLHFRIIGKAKWSNRTEQSTVCLCDLEERPQLTDNHLWPVFYFILQIDFYFYYYRTRIVLHSYKCTNSSNSTQQLLLPYVGRPVQIQAFFCLQPRAQSFKPKYSSHFIC